MTVPRSDFANSDLASPFAVAMTDMWRGAIALVEGALRRGGCRLGISVDYARPWERPCLLRGVGARI